MIRHQNADAMVLAGALMRGNHPRASARRYAEIYYKKLRLRQNHRKNQEDDLLFVSILC
jgi:hypothetical protein